MGRGVPAHKAGEITDEIIARARREILQALAEAGPFGSWGGDLRMTVRSATITDRVYSKARAQLSGQGLVTMRGQRTTITPAGREELAALARKAAA